MEEDPGAGASDTIKKKDHKLVASDTSKYSISGKWFFQRSPEYRPHTWTNVVIKAIVQGPFKICTH